MLNVLRHPAPHVARQPAGHSNVPMMHLAFRAYELENHSNAMLLLLVAPFSAEPLLDRMARKSSN